MEFSSDNFLSEETSLYGCTSEVYNEGLSVVWGHVDSVASSVQSLSDIFVEWYLFDSSKPKTLEEFIESESLRDVFTPEQFMDVMSGAKHIDDNLCELLSCVLPFRITSERISYLNSLIKKCTPELTCSADAIIAKVTEIKNKKKAAQKQAEQKYHHEYHQKFKDRIHAQKREYYLENKTRILEHIRQNYILHRTERLTYSACWRKQNAQHTKQYWAEYRKNNAEIVSERKKRAYQKNKEHYNTKSRAYYLENKTELLRKYRDYRQRNRAQILQRQREYTEKHKTEIYQKNSIRGKEYTQDRQLAKRICPTFRFLMELKANDCDLFLTKFTKRETIATKAKKKCTALQTGDWTQCPLCTGASSTCPITKAFEFENALAEIQRHANQIASENQK